MARVASVKTLELIRGEALLRRPGEAIASPGVVLNIVTVAQPAQSEREGAFTNLPSPAVRIIDADAGD
jgi:hypothetical protein